MNPTIWVTPVSNSSNSCSFKLSCTIFCRIYAFSTSCFCSQRYFFTILQYSRIPSLLIWWQNETCNSLCLSFFSPNLTVLGQKMRRFIKISLTLFGSYDDHMEVMWLKCWKLHHNSVHGLPCTFIIFLTKSLKISATEYYFKMFLFNFSVTRLSCDHHLIQSCYLVSEILMKCPILCRSTMRFGSKNDRHSEI